MNGINTESLETNSSSREQALYAGVELGGTKCVCTLASDPNHIVEQVFVPTEGSEDTLSQIKEVLSRWWRQHGFMGLGIASFGPVELNKSSAHYGQVLATNKRGWQGADIVGVLSAPFDVPVAFDTDVNGAALAELKWGVGQGYDDFAYITIGTGVGVGVIVHGRPTRGVLGHSEAGHMLVPRLPGDTRASACLFHDSCVEGLASGSAVKLRVGEEFIADLKHDDPVWDVVTSAIVHLCHALVSTTGPFRIAVGGGVISRQPHLIERLNTQLRLGLGGYLQLPELPSYIVAPGLGDQAGPLGPIAMARQAVVDSIKT